MNKYTTLRKKRTLCLSCWIMSGALMFATFVVFGQSMAQNTPDQPAKLEQAQPAKNLNEYFRNKYDFQNPSDFVMSSVRSTPNGPKGSLGISAEIRMGNVLPLPMEQGASSIMKCNTWGSRKATAILSGYGKTLQTDYHG